MTIILGLGYYYIPKFYGRNENEENKKITDWLIQKNKKDFDDKYRYFSWQTKSTAFVDVFINNRINNFNDWLSNGYK